MLFLLHWSFHITYITVAWLSWVPNLFVAEWIVRRQRSTATARISASRMVRLRSDAVRRDG
jgi:hypothetical protein